jgi:two-component system, OmpR family, response regulator ChvI
MMAMSLQARMLGIVPPPPVGGAPMDRPMKVIAVDEDAQFRRMLSDELAEYGFDVTTFPDGAALLEAASVASASDLIVLDWSLGGSAIDLLPRLRRAGVEVPVVFVTGRPLMANEDRAFALGALDFIDKSRGIGILVRRLRLAVRNSAPERRCHATLEHGHLTLMPNASRAFWKGEDVDLTVSEFKVVQLFVESLGRAVSYREIYDRMHYCGFVAGYGEDGYRVNVRSTIRRLRVKFRSFDPTFDAIRNAAALGYAWATEPCAPQPAGDNSVAQSTL